MIGITIALSAVASAGKVQEPPAAATRTREKAQTVLELARFVEWPQGALAPADPFVVGVLGDPEFSAEIRRATAGKSIQGRSIRIRSFRNLDEFDPCPVLVVGASKARLLPVILDFLVGTKGVLTVSDGDDFAARGGMVRLIERPDRIAFEINREAARQADVRIGSQLLRLAERVLPEPALPR